MSQRWRWWSMLGLIALLPALASATGGLRPEVAYSDEGKRYVWHRTPATAADLGFAVTTQGAVTESFVYRVRDRKMRDLLRYSRIVITSPQPLDALIAFYRTALGPDVAQESELQTRTVSLAAGQPDDLRLVTLTPRETTIDVRLERTQRFAIPPRVYTAQEQRVLRVLGQIAAAYRTAPRLAYTAEVRVEGGEAVETPAEPVRWSVQFTRPSTLHLMATQGGETALEIVTREGMLLTRPANGAEERQPLGAGVTLDMLPESVYDDPVARLMLGDTLEASADYLALLPVAGAPIAQQAELVLTYPEQGATLRLVLDLPRRCITRSDIVVSLEGETMRYVRTYVYETAPAPAPQSAPIAALSQPQPPPRVPATVQGP